MMMMMLLVLEKERKEREREGERRRKRDLEVADVVHTNEMHGFLFEAKSKVGVNSSEPPPGKMANVQRVASLPGAFSYCGSFILRKNLIFKRLCYYLLRAERKKGKPFENSKKGLVL